MQQGTSILCSGASLAAGERFAIEVTFSVPTDYPCNGMIQNTAAVLGRNRDPNPGDNFISLYTPVTQCSSSSSPVAICGNGWLEYPEQCDDGNTRSGDGCSSTCLIEGSSSSRSSSSVGVGARCYTPSDCSSGLLCSTTYGVCDHPPCPVGQQCPPQCSGLCVHPRPRPCDGWLLTAGKTTLFEVRADVALQPANQSFRLGFDTRNLSFMQASRYADGSQLIGIRLNGVCQAPTSCAIGVTTADATLWHLQGTSADAKLTVAQKALASTDTAVSNQRNVNFLRFETRAENKDVLFTGAAFAAQNGSLLNASNYTLWVDSDGDRAVDTILQSGVASQSGQVSFANLVNGGYVLPKDQTSVFEVHGDIASSLAGGGSSNSSAGTPPVELRLRFATENGAYITAENVSDGADLAGIITNGVGTCPNTLGCDITVTTTDSTLWSLKSQGDLYVTRDAQTFGPRQILGGTLGEPILKIKFHAENEDIDVIYFDIKATGQTQSIDRLAFFKEGETTPFATAVPAPTSGGVNFTAVMNSKQLVVPKGADVKILVQPRLKTDVNGAVSGASITFSVAGSTYARGVLSSREIAHNDGDTIAEGEAFFGTSTPGPDQPIVGSNNVTVLSKVISVVNGGPATGTVPSGVDREIGSFKFSAAPNANSKNGLNQVVIDGLVFTVNGTNVAMASTGFKIYNKTAGSATNLNCSPFSATGRAINGTASGTFLLWCTDLETGIVDTAIDQGASDTFVLLANVTNPNTAAAWGGESILQVSLNDFTNSTKTVFGIGGDQSRIRWRDADSGSSVTFTWIEYPDSAVNSTTYRG